MGTSESHETQEPRRGEDGEEDGCGGLGAGASPSGNDERAAMAEAEETERPRQCAGGDEGQGA